MKRVVSYTAIDPYYSDVVQTYIGATWESINRQQEEVEKFMCGEHVNLGMIYRSEVILERE